MKLVKREEKDRCTYYVPQEYIVYSDTGKDRPDYEDRNASIPSIIFDDETSKWMLEFDSADLGGYDVARFTYYFDRVDDIITFLKQKG